MISMASRPISIADGLPIPARLSADRPLFNVPAGLLRILNRDLKMAGIAKRDERGRTLDLHALRTTFGTLLSKGGVAPRTAQAASDIRLTMGVYTDPKLLDVRGALDSLPSLPLNAGQADIAEAARATGTDHLRRFQFAPTTDKRVQTPSFPVIMAERNEHTNEPQQIDVTSSPVNGKGPLTNTANEPLSVGVTGFEPATSWSRTNESTVLTLDNKEVTSTPSPVCTTVCTTNQETTKTTNLDALAAELLALPKEERARLLAKLLGEGEG
jgi:hypothetical protein